MTSVSLNPDITHRAALEPDSTHIRTRSGWVAWLLGHGYTLDAKRDSALIDATSSTMVATVRALRVAGWIIDMIPIDGTKRRQYQAVRAPDGRTIMRSLSDGALPDAPPHLNGRRGPKPRKRAQSTRKRPAGQTKARAAVDSDSSAAPEAPALGMMLRVQMIADDGGAAALALRDPTGRTWLARIVESIGP